MQKFLNTLWEFTRVKEDKDNFIQKALKVCKVFKVKPLRNQNLMLHQRRQHTICFAERFKRPKKSCRVLQFPRQVQSYRKNGKRLRPARRR